MNIIKCKNRTTVKVGGSMIISLSVYNFIYYIFFQLHSVRFFVPS